MEEEEWYDMLYDRYIEGHPLIVEMIDNEYSRCGRHEVHEHVSAK